MFSYLLLITTWLSCDASIWDLTKDGNLFCGLAKDTFCTNFTFLPSGPPLWISIKIPKSATSGPQLRHHKYYAFYEAVGRPAGDQASFVTPAIKTGGAPACVSFVYYMYGEDLGSLYVTIKYTKAGFNTLQKINENKTVSTGEVLEKLIARGNLGQKWVEKKFQVALKNQTDVQLFFTAMRGNGEKSSIGVDSLNVTSSITSCPIDGNWKQWSGWLDDGLIKNRTRVCTNPGPSHGGLDCLLKDFTRGLSESEQSKSLTQPKPSSGSTVGIVVGIIGGVALIATSLLCT